MEYRYLADASGTLPFALAFVVLLVDCIALKYDAASKVRHLGHSSIQHQIKEHTNYRASTVEPRFEHCQKLVANFEWLMKY